MWIQFRLDAIMRLIAERIALYFVVAAIITVSLCTLFMPPFNRRLHINTKTSHAKNDVDSIRDMLIGLQHEHQRPLAELWPEQSTISNSLLATLMGDTTYPLAAALNPRGLNIMNIDREQIRNDFLVDPWGNPYHISIADKNGVNVVGKHMVTSPVAVWSFGVNGVNEYGDGDDIRSWK